MTQESTRQALDLTVAPSEQDPSNRREPYDPAEDRERVRGRMAQWLLLLLIAVIGAVVGFYYGEQSRRH